MVKFYFEFNSSHLLEIIKRVPKRYCILVYCFYCFNVSAQTYYSFVYDASGNRISKELVGNAPVPTIIGDTTACVGQSKVFTVTQGNVTSYLWDNGTNAQSKSFTADSSRYHKVTVTYINGCKNTGRRWVQVGNLGIGDLVGTTTPAINQTVNYSLSDVGMGSSSTVNSQLKVDR